MLPSKAHFTILHLRLSRSYKYKAPFSVMAHERSNWMPPSRLTVEPVLKVYNSFTRTKVRPFRARSQPTQLLTPKFRMNSSHATVDVSNGTIVDLPYTMLLTWAMQGRFSSSLCGFKTIYPPEPRNYVTQDILRRIMSDYFGYDIHFAMNITDIDDKVDIPIILTFIELNILM
jgi:tRNA synthetases class I (C) catalytic domain